MSQRTPSYEWLKRFSLRGLKPSRSAPNTGRRVYLAGFDIEPVINDHETFAKRSSVVGGDEVAENTVIQVAQEVLAERLKM